MIGGRFVGKRRSKRRIKGERPKQEPLTGVALQSGLLVVRWIDPGGKGWLRWLGCAADEANVHRCWPSRSPRDLTALGHSTGPSVMHGFGRE